MAQDAVIVRFPGNPELVAPRYANGLRQFQEAAPNTRPDVIFLGRSTKTPNELVVVLLWPEGVDHHVLGGFLLERLASLGLERPSAVEHFAIDRVGFEPIAALAM
jgi:hypothetical protein